MLGYYQAFNNRRSGDRLSVNLKTKLRPAVSGLIRTISCPRRSRVWVHVALSCVVVPSRGVWVGGVTGCDIRTVFGRVTAYRVVAGVDVAAAMAAVRAL